MAASSESVVSTAILSTRSEEAHWFSFRGEVLELQHSLAASLFDDSEKNDKGSSSITKHIKKKADATKSSGRDKSANIDSKVTREQVESSTNEDELQLKYRNYQDVKFPQSQLQLSPLQEFDDSNEIPDYEEHYGSTSQAQHHYLELIGMEEVDKSICSVNNKNNMSSQGYSPVNNAMSHASQNTNAHSIATQELAEMKLKLALTESERDELEFELMQRRHK